MNRVVHFEIPAEDPERAKDFYRNVFGWSFEQFGDNSYWLAKTGDDETPGINGAIMKKNHPQQPVTNNISVSDIDTAVQSIEAAGGKIVVPKTAFPGVGWAAYFLDPENNIFGIWKEDKTAQ